MQGALHVGQTTQAVDTETRTHCKKRLPHRPQNEMNRVLGPPLNLNPLNPEPLNRPILLSPKHKDSTSVLTEQAVLSGTVVKFRSKSASTACTVVALKVDM